MEGNLPKYFTDIGGVPCRGWGRDQAHLLHVRANAFSQHRLKHRSVFNISTMEWKPAVSQPGGAAPTFNVLAAAATTCAWGDSRQDMVAENRRGRWPNPRELCKLDRNAHSSLICHAQTWSAGESWGRRYLARWTCAFSMTASHASRGCRSFSLGR